MINRGRCVTLVLLDTLSTKHDHRWIHEHARLSVGLVPLTLKFQFSIHINS